MGLGSACAVETYFEPNSDKVEKVRLDCAGAIETYFAANFEGAKKMIWTAPVRSKRTSTQASRNVETEISNARRSGLGLRLCGRNVLRASFQAISEAHLDCTCAVETYFEADFARKQKWTLAAPVRSKRISSLKTNRGKVDFEWACASETYFDPAEEPGNL